MFKAMKFSKEADECFRVEVLKECVQENLEEQSTQDDLEATLVYTSRGISEEVQDYAEILELTTKHEVLNMYDAQLFRESNILYP